MFSYIISNNVSIEIFTYNNYNILSFPYFINTGFFLYRIDFIPFVIFFKKSFWGLPALLRTGIYHAVWRVSDDSG